MTEFSCPFGIAEKLLREKEYPSEPDREFPLPPQSLWMD